MLPRKTTLPGRCSALLILSTLTLLTSSAQSAITINLSDGGMTNGSLVEIRGSADFSSLSSSASATSDDHEFISLGPLGILAVGNEWDAGPGSNSFLISNAPTIDFSGVDLTLGDHIRESSNGQGSLPYFGYSHFSSSLYWDDDYVDNTVLNVTQFLGANYLFTSLLGSGAAVKTSTITWDNGNESLTFIIGETAAESSIPEPSSALLLLSAFILGASRRTRAR